MKIIVFLITEDWYFYSHRINLAKEAIKSGFKVYLLSNFFEAKSASEGFEKVSSSRREFR